MKIINENAFRDFVDAAKSNGIEPHQLRPLIADNLARQIEGLLDRFVPYAEAPKESADPVIIDQPIHTVNPFDKCNQCGLEANMHVTTSGVPTEILGKGQFCRGFK